MPFVLVMVRVQNSIHIKLLIYFIDTWPTTVAPCISATAYTFWVLLTSPLQRSAIIGLHVFLKT